jgi:hypothetical protein
MPERNIDTLREAIEIDMGQLAEEPLSGDQRRVIKDHLDTLISELRTRLMKFIAERPYADPEAAARKLLEIANSVEAVQDGRIHIELINWPFLHDLKASPAEYSAGLNLAIERGWLGLHESGTYVKFTQAGAELFA